MMMDLIVGLRLIVSLVSGVLCIKSPQEHVPITLRVIVLALVVVA